MNRPLYVQYANIRPHGVLQLTNTFGIAIWVEDDSTVVTAWSSDEGYYNYRRQKIFENFRGKHYIIKGGNRYYLNDFTRL